MCFLGVAESQKVHMCSTRGGGEGAEIKKFPVEGGGGEGMA